MKKHTLKYFGRSLSSAYGVGEQMKIGISAAEYLEIEKAVGGDLLLG